MKRVGYFWSGLNQGFMLALVVRYVGQRVLPRSESTWPKSTGWFALVAFLEFAIVIGIVVWTRLLAGRADKKGEES